MVLGADTLFWEHANGHQLLDLAGDAATPVDLKGVPAELVVASPDGSQLVFCDDQGWVRLVTLGGKKPVVKRVRVAKSLSLSGAGFTAEHVVLRGISPGHEVTLHHRETLELVGKTKLGGDTTAVSPRGEVFTWGGKTERWAAPFKKAEPFSKSELIPLGFTHDGAALLGVEGDDYVAVDAGTGKVGSRALQDKVATAREDRVLPMSATAFVRVGLERPAHDVQDVTVEVWKSGKRAAKLELTFNAGKKQRGLAQELAITERFIVLNAETVVDVR